MSAMVLAVSLISLLGWLTLNLASFRHDAERIGWRRTVRMVLVWAAIIFGLFWLVRLLES